MQEAASSAGSYASAGVTSLASLIEPFASELTASVSFQDSSRTARQNDEGSEEDAAFTNSLVIGLTSALSFDGDEHHKATDDIPDAATIPSLNSSLSAALSFQQQPPSPPATTVINNDEIKGEEMEGRDAKDSFDDVAAALDRANELMAAVALEQAPIAENGHQNDQTVATAWGTLLEDSARRPMWLAWTGANAERKNHPLDQYTKWSRSEDSSGEKTEALETIAKDVERESTDLPLFRDGSGPGSESLTRILTAYTKYDAEMSYVQGMSSLAAFLLLVFQGGGDADEGAQHSGNLEDSLEEDAFWVFTRVVHSFRSYFEKGMRGLLYDSALLSHLVTALVDAPCASSIAAAWRSMKRNNFEFIYVTPDWFIRLFSGSGNLSNRAATRVWDFIFYNIQSTGPADSESSAESSLPGEHRMALVFVALAILLSKREQIGKCILLEEVIDVMKGAAQDFRSETSDLDEVGSLIGSVGNEEDGMSKFLRWAESIPLTPQSERGRQQGGGDSREKARRARTTSPGRRNTTELPAAQHRDRHVVTSTAASSAGTPSRAQRRATAKQKRSRSRTPPRSSNNIYFKMNFM